MPKKRDAPKQSYSGRPSFRGVKEETMIKLTIYAARKRITLGEALNEIVETLKD